jgi:chemotaxis protein CheZ
MTDGSVTPELSDASSQECISNPEYAASGAEYQGTAGNTAIGLVTIRHSEIPQAIERLDDIVRGTENAANQVMDACAALEKLAEEIGGDAAERINDALTAIYEACCFQDLAGQRITSVTKTLGLIEVKLSELTAECGIFGSDDHEIAALVGSDAADPLADVQLNGPQHPENATDQAEIDRLFAQIG